MSYLVANPKDRFSCDVEMISLSPMIGTVVIRLDLFDTAAEK